ncbi:MAG: Do family serine endopeptidase [Gemmatimonadetes bacterium]|nr:Do family serine endopeptidase [Gemmatimonadota bacterium]
MFDPVRAKAKAIVFTAAAFTGGVLFASGLEWTTGGHAASLLQTAPTAAEVRPVADLSEAFIAIAEAATPAVVNITTERTRPATTRGQPAVPEEFRRFFNMPDGPPGGQDVPLPGTGTGFLVTGDGYIMTNNHVVEDANRIQVTLHDRRQFDARVIGRDPTTDVAVIKIEGTGFTPARIGRSETTRVGEWVLAIGNPLGLDFTVTSGIISARGRGLGIIGQGLENRGTAIEDFIQTDAAINPGNSGGPLVNLRGEVIGINTAIAGSRTGTFTGYGFAVPIDLARRVADDLIQYGRSRRPILGVNIQQVTPEDAEAFGLPRVAGAVVQNFSEGSPAQRAGLQRGDVIVGVDGRPIDQSNQLQRVIATRQPGETLVVDVIRQGEALQLRVQLAEAPAPPTAATRAPARGRAEQRLGMQVAPLTTELARQLGFSNTEGVVITEIQPHTPGGQRGLRRGTRILVIDRQPVRDVEQFQRLLAAKRPGEVVSLDVETIEQGTANRAIVNIRVP